MISKKVDKYIKARRLTRKSRESRRSRKGYNQGTTDLSAVMRLFLFRVEDKVSTLFIQHQIEEAKREKSRAYHRAYYKEYRAKNLERCREYERMKAREYRAKKKLQTMT